MNGIDSYYKIISAILDNIMTKERAAIERAAEYFADAVENKKSIYVFGCAHGAIITEELFYRAGGLAVINPIFNPALMLNVRPVTLTSRFERMAGQSKAILDEINPEPEDVLLIHSVSGRNSGIVEMALEARARGMTVIGITSLSYSKVSESRHESGLRLFEICDICIDNQGIIGDGSVAVKGIKEKAGATSTVAGAFIANSISIRTAEILAERNILPPVLHSANIQGGDEINKKIFTEYRNVIHYL